VDGKVIAYSGDTEWTDALISAGRDADLFICEAYFYEREVRNHVSFKQVEKHLAAIRLKRLILTHMADEALTRMDGTDFETANDGMVVEL
jgi:ribonuclease BN (tRNA processing enzyme)